MTRRILVGALALLFTVSGTALARPPEGDEDSGSTAAAILALITDDAWFATADLTLVLPASQPAGATPTQRYGPYESGSPDSGTCGNNWAEDEFNRVFFVRQDDVDSYTVVQQFRNGTFVTNAGPSPGACQTNDGSDTALIEAGKTGRMHGYFIISVEGTQTSEDESCVANAPAAPCTTAGFLGSHFAGAFTIGTFFFHYSAGDQGLVAHEWKNASEDRGGNHGDIATE